ncbi:putative MAP protein kinase, partial [Trypanosoma rangeli]
MLFRVSGNQNTDDQKQNEVEECSDISPFRNHRMCRVRTVFLIAGTMCFGVLLVGIVGFVPMYFVTFTEAMDATHRVHAHAVDMLLATTNISTMYLPTLIHAISANYALTTNSSSDFFPKSKEKLLFAMSNVISKKLCREIVGHLMVVVAGPPEEEWGVLATSVFDGDQIGGSVMHGMSTSPIYRINPEIGGFVFPPRNLTLRKSNLKSILTNDNGSYKAIAVPWNASTSQGVMCNTRWFTSGVSYSPMYFKYVLPFVVNNSLGFWEVALKPSVLAHWERLSLSRALRNNGRLMLLDSKMDLVVLNNWGQQWKIKTVDGGQFEVHPLHTHNISDSLAQAAIGKVHRGGGFARFMKETDRSELSFQYKGDKAYALIMRLTDDTSSDILLVIVTLQADFFWALDRSSTYVALATGLSVMMVAIFAVSIACFLVKPMRRLAPELKRAANLQLRGQDDNSGVWKRSRIAEIRDVQDAYAELTRQLTIVKTFVPGAILASPATSCCSSNSNARKENSFSRKKRGFQSHSSSQLRESPINSRAEMVGMEHNCFSKVRQEMCFNSRVFKERTNTFVRQYCTMVLIENAQPRSLDTYFDNIFTCATEQNGCPEYSRPDRTLVSFGAHSPLPMHAIKGCRFAFELFSKLSSEEKQTITLFIATEEFHVGTCGAQSKNARSVVGIMNLRELAKAANRLGCRIAATSGTASQLQAHQAYPIECILPSSSSEAVVLFELRPETAGWQTMSTPMHFRLGFAAMRQGNYKQAMSHFQRIEKSDRQTKRLIRLCAQRCAINDNTSYVRSASDILQERLPNVSVAAAREFGPTATYFTETTFCKIVSNPKTIPSVSSRASSHSKCLESESGALFELLKVCSSSSSAAATSLQACEEVGNTADDLPLLLTDMNKRVWTRSLKKISEGAFSSVYLGMSEDGVQVAIKCIPRLRRDIKQESLEAEMNIASTLRHPNIVQYVSCSVIQSHLAIIMEYVPGGSLHAVIKNFGRMGPLVARRFTVDILNGLNYLHGLGIVHCD